MGRFAKVRRPTPESQLRFSQEFVFVDDRGHGYFAVAIINPHDFPFAADSDAFGQSDFRRKGKCEFDGRPWRDGRIYVEANTSGTHVARLGASLLRSVV